jgi:hypothetical protein
MWHYLLTKEMFSLLFVIGSMVIHMSFDHLTILEQLHFGYDLPEVLDYKK